MESEDSEDSGSGSLPRWIQEKQVMMEEEELLRPRRMGAPGAGQMLAGENVEPFAVAFGGGGVRSGAFCSGVLWALAETNRLRHVTHISSVSGGSIAASGFSSFLVARQSTAPRGQGLDQWYREVVAEFIERSQRNAGYLVSFDNLWKAPEDHSSKVPRSLDLPLMCLVVLGVLVAAPLIFCVFYVVPVSMLIEAFWGGAMRDCFCIPPPKEQCGFLDLLQVDGTASHRIEGSFSLVVLVFFVTLLVILAFVYSCCGIENSRIGDNPKRYLHWRALVHLSSRWLVMLVLIAATVQLVFQAELWDYGKYRALEGKNVCAAYWKARKTGGGGLCSGLWPPDEHLLAQSRFKEFQSMIQEEEDELLSELADQGNTTNSTLQTQFKEDRKGFSFIWSFFVLTLGFGVVALSFKFLGWSGLWKVWLAVLLPLWFIWPASFLLQWRIFGPITGQALVSPVFDTQIVGKYTERAWTIFTTMSLILAVASLPLFNFLHRFVHIYFRVSLQRAFYHDGADVPVEKVAKCPFVPVLLFGATLNEFQRPENEEPHCLFSLSQHAMGCQRTNFVRCPQWMTLSKCMTLSCAAIDGFVLTQINKWHTRILMAMLNLTQGDWLRFDIGQNWHSLSGRFPALVDQPHIASLIDRMPDMILFACIYLFILIANLNSTYSSGTELDNCDTFKFFRNLSAALIGIFIGIFSFFGHVPCLSWLLSSPLIRQIHMFLMYHECLEKPPVYLYLTDGGPVEDLGLVQLLRRRQRWILSFDVGDDPNMELLDLHTAIALARKEKICSFYLASDPRRDLEDVLEEYSKNLEPFLHLGVLYPQMSDGIREIGEIFHVRMRLLEPSVPVQPLVQREEVLGERGIFSLSRVAPVVDVEMPAREHMREYSLSSETSNSDSPRQKPRSELGGICCECCHEWSKGALCGSFPNTHTANQFFTPKVWANFCRLGRELSSPAIAALTNAQMAEINARRARMTP